MPDKYEIDKDSSIASAMVDDKTLELGDDPISLTASQVKRLEDGGVKLSKSTNDK